LWFPAILGAKMVVGALTELHQMAIIPWLILLLLSLIHAEP
jgi:hypothetical protein